MIDIDSISKQVSKNTGYNIDIVKSICQHVFLKTVEIMKSEKTDDVLFNGFKLKRRYKNDKTKKYTTK